MRRIAADHLRVLRNAVPISKLVVELSIPTQKHGVRMTFRCPLCGVFATATNPRTNLARCFRCRRNFNTIELVIAERRVSFLDAVSTIERLAVVASRTLDPSTVAQNRQKSLDEQLESKKHPSGCPAVATSRVGSTQTTWRKRRLGPPGTSGLLFPESSPQPGEPPNQRQR